ncbi:hypothetical protein [Paraburkholderia sp. SIMBA_054]|uniref:hypothetical protein n=1 Tax=Paraburkholderia sp. SIMBA_054 TaxID=3085795 RepID=UPI0039781212
MNNNIFERPNVRRNADVYRLISKLRNQEKRNILRGYYSKTNITADQVETMRQGNSLFDSMIVGAVLKGPGGLLERNPNKSKTSKDVYRFTTFPPLNWQNELCYTIGYMNSSCDAILEMLNYFKSLAFLECMNPGDALNLLQNLAKRFGASNYLSYKLAYVRSAFPLTAGQLRIVSEIERDIEHRNSVGMHFSALENVSSKISLFVVAQRRVSGHVGKIKGEFRRSLALSNFIPTPLNNEDLGAFLLRATESSLIDTLYAILTILNLGDDFAVAQREIYSRINPDLAQNLKHLIKYFQIDDNNELQCGTATGPRESGASMPSFL